MRLRGRHVRGAAGARISERLTALLGDLPESVERLGGAATAIGASLRQQSLGMRAIDLRSLRLPVAMIRRALIPREPEPAQGIDDGVDVFLRRARPIRVLDPEDEDAAVMTREQPVEERSPSATDVEMAGGAGSKAHANRLGHRFSFYSERLERVREVPVRISGDGSRRAGGSG